MKWFRMSLVSVVLTLLVVGILSHSCGNSNRNSLFQKKYILIPSARFVPHQHTEPLYPICTAEYPLSCGDVCCKEEYPFLCPSQNRCYANQPDAECPGEWKLCTLPDVLITGIAPHNASLKFGESVNISVSFRQGENEKLQKLILSFSGVDGEFEQNLTEEQRSAELIETTIQILSEVPSLTTCLQECSRSGECGPCYVETTMPSWSVHFMLSDDTSATGTASEWLNLSWESESSTYNPECNDGSACCTVDPDCGGGISCMITGITTPEECECPANTTYESTDVYYNVKICSCNDC